MRCTHAIVPPQDEGTAEGGQEHKESLPESFQVESDVQVLLQYMKYYITVRSGPPRGNTTGGNVSVNANSFSKS